MKELIKKLKAGAVNTERDVYNYDDFYNINIDATDALMKEAAEAFERMQAKIDAIENSIKDYVAILNVSETLTSAAYRLDELSVVPIGSHKLYLHSNPSPPLLTEERIAEILGIKYDILMREFAEYPNTCALTIVRNIEKEIRIQYE